MDRAKKARDAFQTKRAIANAEFRIVGGLKKCKLCKQIKEVALFQDNVRYLDGKYKHCKDCHYEVYGRDAHFRRSYGLSLREYNSLAAAQSWVCKTCGKPCGESRKTRLVVDHCHSSGKVRGLICMSCNSALGHAMDSPEILRKLALYLEAFYANK